MYSQVSGTGLRSNVTNFIRCRLYPRSKFIVILVAGLHVDQRNILHALLLFSVHYLIMSVHYQFLIYCYRVAWPEPILVEFIYVVRCLSEVHLERYMVPVYLVWVLAIFCFFYIVFPNYLQTRPSYQEPTHCGKLVTGFALPPLLYPWVLGETKLMPKIER